ncbi:MAG: HvfC/BufC N-terminal domain-containing protein, partial [Reyranella sp.]
MPLALRDLQAAFAAHIMGADRADLVTAVTGDTIPAAARLSVYRHHVFESLGTALAASFPTVQALVGPDFFRGLARAFVRHTLPVQPVLTEYGADFPIFI